MIPLLALHLSVVAPAQPACDIFRSSWTRSRATNSFLIARAVRDSTLIPPWRVRQGVHVYGQIFEVLAVGGADSARIEGAVALAPQRRVAVVLWGTNADCTWKPPDAALFVTEDTVVFIEGELRTRTAPSMLFPVFDIDPEWHHHLYVPRSQNARGLRAWEYAQMYAALPVTQYWASNPQAALSAFDGWLAAHPDLRDRPPVPFVRERLAERGP